MCFISPRDEPEFRHARWSEIGGHSCTPWSAMGSQSNLLTTLLKKAPGCAPNAKWELHSASMCNLPARLLHQHRSFVPNHISCNASEPVLWSFYSEPSLQFCSPCSRYKKSYMHCACKFPIHGIRLPWNCHLMVFCYLKLQPNGVRSLQVAITNAI